MYLRTGKDTQAIREAEVAKARRSLEKTWSRIDQKKIPYASKYAEFSHYVKILRNRVCTEVFKQEFKKTDQQIKEQTELEELTEQFTQIDIADDNMPKGEPSAEAEEMTDIERIKNMQAQIRAFEEKERRYKDTLVRTNKEMDRQKSELQQARAENQKLVQELQVKQEGETDQHEQETEDMRAELNAEIDRLQEERDNFEAELDQLRKQKKDPGKQIIRTFVEPSAAKLQPYKSGDYLLWDSKFEELASGNNWDEGRRKRELMMLLQGKAEMIIRNKDSSEWTSQTLRDACKQRLVQKKNIPQLTVELAEIKTELSDDPDSIMDKIETVLLKAGPDVSRIRLNRLKLDKFMELIRDNQPLYFYVETKLEKTRVVTFQGKSIETDPEPYRALELANEYIQTQGHQVEYMQKIVKQTLEKAGMKIPDKDSIPMFGAEKAEVKQMTEELEDAEVRARFLRKGTQVTNDELIYRLNEGERFRRDLKEGKIFPGCGNEQKQGQYNVYTKKTEKEKTWKEKPERSQFRSRKGSRSYDRGHRDRDREDKNKRVEFKYRKRGTEEWKKFKPKPRKPTKEEEEEKAQIARFEEMFEIKACLETSLVESDPEMSLQETDSPEEE